MSIDYNTQEGALKAASEIEKHWKKRGYNGILARVICFPHKPHPQHAHAIYYAVRSNIGRDGFPPRQIELGAGA